MTAVNIIANVVILSAHKSTKSIKSKLRKANIANLNPFVLYASTTKIRSIIGNGIKLKSVSKLFKTVSIGAEIF